MAERPIYDLVRAVLAARQGIELGILFGSCASGTAAADSDVDIAVQMPRAISAEEKMALVGDLSEATGRAIDLVDLRTAGEPLLGQVLRHGKRLVGSDEAFAALLSRHLIDSADFMPYVERLLAERRKTWIGR